MPSVAPYFLEAANNGSGVPSRHPRLSIGIVNNMPDAALQATERQFVTLLQAAATACDIRIHLFTLPGIPRAGAALERIKARYIDYAALRELHMDALIVTGAVPASSSVAAEPFWPDFQKLVDWARDNTVSTIWSCLGAHAAVMHLDGIQRIPLKQKLSGVFTSRTTQEDALVSGVAPTYCTPHSRYNEVSEGDLLAAGYAILGRSDQAGVDIFSKDTPSRFIFMQGHPEYDGDTLMREYRRDVLQFVRGERLDYPAVPANYFPVDLAAQLRDVVSQASARRDVDILVRGLELSASSHFLNAWSSSATQIFRSWIGEVAALKAKKAVHAAAAA